ncbi:MAG: WG repeat-containing protein [Spirochaetaceae bacterium]|nr:MAG: WG repeat-containing protein [Spirochaetaceae bacterium]
MTRRFDMNSFRLVALAIIVILVFSAACVSEPGASGSAMVPKPNYVHGYINSKGEVVVPMTLDRADDFSEGLAFVMENNKGRYLNFNGGTAFQAPYADAGKFQQGLAGVLDQQKGWGFIDRQGTVVIGCRFTAVTGFDHNIAGASSGGKWGFIDNFGLFMIQPSFDMAREFRDGLAPVAKRTGWDNSQPVYSWGYVDAKGNMAIPFQFDDAHSFSGGLALVGKRVHAYKYNHGYINSNGTLAIPYQFMFARDFTGSSQATVSAAVGNGEKWGVVDSSGKLIIAFSFAQEVDLSRSLNLFYKDGLFGYMDRDGKTVIPAQYDDAHQFSEGMAVVGKKVQ